VFNFDVPHHAEDYVHRIGRTGRAGRDGKAFTIATPEDRLAVEAIEKLIAAPIPRIEIPGLDVVEWAEDDGRRGRGRGRGKPVAKPPMKAPVKEEPRVERAPRPPRRDAPAPRAEEPRRREPRYADRGQDNGPNVVGFGSEVPAFMLIRKRAAAASGETFSDIPDDDAPDETTNNEIAA
jgi:superfamily II DNA/RNA helicase